MTPHKSTGSLSSESTSSEYTKNMSARYSNDSRPCQIKLENYSFDVQLNKNQYKTILRNINMANDPGSFLAIMGASGSGKSTLLNCIAQRSRGRESGRILYNGTEMTQHKLQQSHLLRYVMSSDSHLGFLTVYETMMYSARLKLTECSKQVIQDRVESLICMMELETVRNVRVGSSFGKGLSSGELRRLSIAVELIDNPEIILLDEPTSGLDSRRALSMIPILGSLANEAQKNVIITIHQPSSAMFKLFDTVIFLTAGKIFYWGPAKGLMNYINSRMYKIHKPPYTAFCNPADFVIDLISPILRPNISDESSSGDDGQRRVVWDNPYVLTQAEADEWCNDYYESAVYENMMGRANKEQYLLVGDHKKSMKGCGKRFLEFVILFERFFVNSIRNPMESVFLVMFSSLLAILLGLFFWQSIGVPDHTPSATTTYIEDFIDYVFQEDHPLRAALNAPKIQPIDGNGLPIPDAPPLSTWLQDTVIDPVQYHLVSYVRDPDDIYAMNSDGTPKVEVTVEKTTPVTYSFDDFPINIPGSVDESLHLTTCVRNNLMNISDEYVDALDIEYRYKYWNMPPFPPKYATDDLINTRKGITLAYRAVAMIDFLFEKINRADLPAYDLYSEDGPWIMVKGEKKAVKDFAELGLFYWVKLMACYGDELNAMLGCFNFPNLPDLRVEQAQTLFSVYGLDTDCSRTTRANVKTPISEVLKNIAEESETTKPPAAFDPDAALVYKLFAVGSTVQDDIKALTNDCDYDECHSLNTMLKDLAQDLSPMVLSALGSIFHNGGMLLFLVIITVFASFDGLLTFQQQRVLFNRETFNNMYHPSSYYWAKVLAALPFNYMHTFAIFFLYFFMIGLDASKFGSFLALFICITWASYGFNYLFAAICKSLQAAVMVVPLAVIVMMVTTGYFIREELYPKWIGWIKYFSYSRWGFQGMFIINYPAGEGSVGLIPNNLARILSGIEDDNLPLCFGVLIAMGIVYRILGFIGLKYFHRQEGLEN